MRLRILLALVLAATVVPAGPARSAADAGPGPTGAADFAAFPGQNGVLAFGLLSGDIGIISEPGATPQPIPRVFANQPQSDPIMSPDGREIAFVVDGPANTLIFGWDVVDQRAIQYTFDEMPINGARHPTWLPDGSGIVFTATDLRTSTPHFFVVPRGGGDLQFFGPQEVIGTEPMISPAGDQMIFWDEADDELRYLDLQTGQVRVVHRSDPEGIFFGQDPRARDERGRLVVNLIEPDWAPDGQSFVVNCNAGALCRMAANGSGGTILTPIANRMYSGGAFAPTGQEIIYSGLSRIPDDPALRLFTMPSTGIDAQGNGETQITQPADPNEANSNIKPSAGPAVGTTPNPTGQTPVPGGTGGPGTGGPGTGGPIFSGDPAVPTSIDSADPGAVALELSRRRFPGAPRFADGGRQANWAVLSRDDTFPDSLAGTALTGDAPMLLTDRSALDAAVGQELGRLLEPGGTVYLLGGEAALSAAVEQAVRDLGLQPVRLAGPGRVETALAVADEVRRVHPDTPAAALLARAGGPSGNPTAGWADSVSAGGLAADQRIPILLTDSAALSPAVADWIQANGVTNTVLLGGAAALSAGMEDQVPRGVRVEGPDRTATAAAVATTLWQSPESGPRRYVLVNGHVENGWAFGLVAAGVGADADAPTVLVGDTVSPASTDLLSECGAKAVETVAMGDTSIIPQAVRNQVEALDGQDC